MRGFLTPEIQLKATELFDRPIEQRELRLMPYIQFVMVNNQVLTEAFSGL
jgi:hypothetical protein